MDDHWEDEVTEYGALNITGFRIVDLSRKNVKDFMEGLKRMDPRFKGTVSVSSFFMKGFLGLAYLFKIYYIVQDVNH